jgi:MFS family permease
MLSPLYMAEISPPEVRGSLLALEQFSIVLGCVVGFWTGFFTRNGRCALEKGEGGRTFVLVLALLTPSLVAGSLSWRIPLALQLIPGILLGLGTFALPPSPRLLVLQGQKEAALASLAALRLRPLSEARTDPLIQVSPPAHSLTDATSHIPKIELIEMEAEAIMLQRSSPICGGPSLRNEALAWARLFDNRYIDRTLVGVMVMFFQRECRWPVSHEQRWRILEHRPFDLTHLQNGLASMP